MDDMKNIYDVRREEELLYILPTDNAFFLSDQDIFEKCVVVVNLYYLDTVAKYMDYLNIIPQYIDIYIYSSDTKVLKCAEDLCKRNNVIYQLKPNRGRDVSALLVAFGRKAFQYDYICFLHDKKENMDYQEDDVKIWIDNLWGNTIRSEQYIHNVLNVFRMNKEIGVLAPPEAIGDHLTYWCDNVWGYDYDICKQLEQDLGLHTDISDQKDVFTLGTVFWARTNAIKKIMEKSWNYEDFPQEPMPIDGTISHAIERMWGYVAQDAGYKTGTIMSEKYAAWLLLYVQEDMKTLFRLVREREHVYDLQQIRNMEQRAKRIEDFCNHHKNIYIYGAGVYGKSLYQFMKERDCEIEGFVVGKGRRCEGMVERKKVCEIQEIDVNDENGIIIGVNYELRQEIETDLKEKGFTEFIYGYSTD